ncbi:MAG: M48 family metalloprotease [Alphaproteobacteria bacterium]|nr:M48 family metalloprotease [Alphaproteobacteria bacterium]
MRGIYTSVILIILLNIVGCASVETQFHDVSASEIKKEERIQREMVLNVAEREEIRVLRVAYPIMVANAPLCSKVAHTAGLGFWSEFDFKKDERPFAKRSLFVDENVRVRFVHPNSPAAIGGIQVDDILVVVNGKEIVSGRKGDKTYKNIFKNYKKDSFSAVFKRKNNIYNVELKFDEQCDYKVRYDYRDSEINAWADGKRVVIARGILRFAEDDHTLAGVIAHELAHNVMVHAHKVKHNASVGALAGFVLDRVVIGYADIDDGGIFSEFGKSLGWGAHSVKMEQEADYVGLYFMERAGYDISIMPHFWRKMASENYDKAIGMETSHPTSVKRFIALEKTRAEIAKKKRAGAPLLPNKNNRSFRVIKTDLEYEK